MTLTLRLRALRYLGNFLQEAGDGAANLLNKVFPFRRLVNVPLGSQQTGATAVGRFFR